MIKILQGYILQGQPTNQFNDVSARKPLEGLNEPGGGGGYSLEFLVVLSKFGPCSRQKYFYSFSELHFQAFDFIFIPVFSCFQTLKPNELKAILAFRPARFKHHIPWSNTYLYSLYRGLPIPPLRGEITLCWFVGNCLIR